MLAHQIGHALGMKHDFIKEGTTRHMRYDSSGNRCTGMNGLMDDGPKSRRDKFTKCSREDFASWYRRVVQRYGTFCLTCGNLFKPSLPIYLIRIVNS